MHTAYLDSLELLTGNQDLELVVNNQGTGDVYHSHTYGPYYFWKGRRYRGRRIFTAHVIPETTIGSFPFRKIALPLSRWYLRKVYEYADVCIAISPTVERTIRELGVHTRVVNLVNPIPLERWRFTEEKRGKGRDTLGLGEMDFVVLGVGQLIGRKGVEDFLDVAEAIPQAKFVWAGGRPWGILSEGLVRIAARIRQAPGNVTFTGMLDLDQMPFIYAAADMLLFPSYQENCPMAPMEAAACGLPVVFRNLKEYALLYEHPYLSAGSTPEFIEMTYRLMRDRDFYLKGKGISEELVKQFDKEAFLKKLTEVYHSLVIN